ncbi:hypothetical protein P170DRAFT_355574 [Aspergillus steynii IBT 23096]|uniref:Saccharopine dehydrogenase NADP binding domain-containing protein n=1 Tax=Aspergillus steynii IBT 23096 TaxID=1392250 RepID=A0A2I2GD41_9EURO|nr:uncharacterized protein P170DRAFT_355574 [Aspergillus steynii IBT 23096]PLB50814.1 hypothetical protein P170DRAFT_355574 [Aspergillus steynii IBT 23096]
MYDIVLLGATGYTGSLCATFIVENFPSTLKWCIAGRSATRLEKLVKDLTAQSPDRLQPAIETVEINTTSLEPLVKSAKVIINGIGPYHKLSTPVVDVCARVGTHYVDFTTETLWIRDMIEKYHKLAQDSGAIIIPGISPSGVSDILAWLLVKKIRETFGQNVSEIVCSGKLDIKAMTGGSLTTVLDVFSTYGTSWFLCPSPSILSPKPQVSPRTIPKEPLVTRLFGYRHSPELGHLTTSFNGSGNEAIVYRSASQNPNLYGASFQFKEYLPAPGVFGAILIHFLTKLLVVFLSISPIRALIKALIAGKMDLNPDITQLRSKESVEFHAVGKVQDSSDFRAWASFTRKGALYEFAALMSCVGAGVLLEKHSKSGKSEEKNDRLKGVVTPSALGMKFVERVRDAGIEVNVGLLDR